MTVNHDDGSSKSLPPVPEWLRELRRLVGAPYVDRPEEEHARLLAGAWKARYYPGTLGIPTAKRDRVLKYPDDYDVPLRPLKGEGPP